MIGQVAGKECCGQARQASVCGEVGKDEGGGHRGLGSPKVHQITFRPTINFSRGIQSMKSIIDDNRYQSIPIDIN